MSESDLGRDGAYLSNEEASRGLVRELENIRFPYESLPHKPEPASEAQREWCKGKPCVICGRADVNIAPAHLTGRRLGRVVKGEEEDRVEGGCDHIYCAVPMCHSCHMAFDTGSRRINIIKALILEKYKQPQHAEIYERLVSRGPQTFPGLLKVTDESFKPYFRHAMRHFNHLKLGYPLLRKELLFGSWIFRDQSHTNLQAHLMKIRLLQRQGRL